MKELFTYFREHRGQRLALTLSFTALLSAGLTFLLRDPLGDYMRIHKLTSSDPTVRQRSTNALIRKAFNSPKTLRRLERRLTDASDEKFSAVARVLNRAGLFNVPGRDPQTLDRWRAIRVASSPNPNSRHSLIWEACLVDRDNVHVRHLLATAATDGEAGIRSLATVLAAKLADDATLGKLLADESPGVRAIAAIDAGIAGRKQLIESAAANGEEADPYVADCIVWALATVGSDLAAPAVCENLKRLTQRIGQQPDNAEADDVSLRRNLLIAGMLGDDSVTDAVAQLLAAYSQAGKPAPALAILVAARRGLTDVQPHVRQVLQAVTAAEAELTFTPGQVIAALESADLLNMPVRREVYDIVAWAWHPSNEDVMTVAARVLARQAELPQNLPDTPSRKTCMRLLVGRSGWYLREQLPGELDTVLYTPIASASAAVAVWRLGGERVEDCLRASASSPDTLAGDYIAWHIARDGPGDGMAIGMTMLPELAATFESRVYNDNIRSAGAMMIALAARTDQQRSAAIERIRSRLIGGKYGGEDMRHVRWSYMCALAIAGDDTYRPQLAALLSVAEFSSRRLLTALLVRGDRQGMDWLLWHSQLSDGDVLTLLVDSRIGEVLAAVAPELPTIERAGWQDIRLWQMRILRDTYAIRRATIRMQGLP